MESLTDEQLVDRVREGNPEAYRTIVDRHKTYVMTIIYHMVGSRETAEDLAQEVFLKLFRTIAGFRGEAKFTTWLYRLAANTAADYRRAQRRRPVSVVLDRVKDWFGDRSKEPERAVEREEERQSIRSALAALPDKYRLILVLYHYRQLSYQEIADICELPVKTVETRLYRGRTMLREKWLEVRGDEEPSSERSEAGSVYSPQSGGRRR